MDSVKQSSSGENLSSHGSQKAIEPLRECSNILQENMGRTYNLSDKTEEALHHAISNGQEACAEVVAFMVKIASESITKARKQANYTLALRVSKVWSAQLHVVLRG